MHLERELFGGHQNGHAWCAFLTSLNVLKQRQNKRSGLACACLGHRNEIMSSQDARDCLLLDGRRFAEPHVVQRPQELPF